MRRLVRAGLPVAALALALASAAHAQTRHQIIFDTDFAFPYILAMPPTAAQLPPVRAARKLVQKVRTWKRKWLAGISLASAPLPAAISSPASS